jgi:hypothetical protein
MKKRFKVEAVYEGSSIYYAVYQKRFFWGWKFISKFVHKEDATRMAKELSQPPIYFKYKKIIIIS